MWLRRAGTWPGRAGASLGVAAALAAFAFLPGCSRSPAPAVAGTAGAGNVLRRTGDEVVDRAISWLDSVEGRPFFLWVHLYDPHAPYRPPPDFAKKFPGRPYEASIAYADACVGRLVAHLSSRGRLAKTLVAVAGDHGESLGEHGETTHGVFLYDATLHVPLLLAWFGEGKAKAGGEARDAQAGAPEAPRRVAAVVSLADVAPTIAEAAALPGEIADGTSDFYQSRQFQVAARVSF